MQSLWFHSGGKNNFTREIVVFHGSRNISPDERFDNGWIQIHFRQEFNHRSPRKLKDVKCL